MSYKQNDIYLEDKKEVEKEATEAFKIHKSIIDIKKNITYNFLELGKNLYYLKINKFFKVLDYNTFNSYLSSPEVSLSLSTAYALMDIYDTFLVKLKIAQSRLLSLGRGKLEKLLPIIDKNNADNWLNKAENLSITDLILELKEEKKEPIFEYKYTKNSRLAFSGNTQMERLLEKRNDLIEWYCSQCDIWFWTNGHKPKICPFCNLNIPLENGKITYKDLKEND